MVGRVKKSEPFWFRTCASNDPTGPLDCPYNTVMPRRARPFSPFSNVVSPPESDTACTPRAAARAYAAYAPRVLVYATRSPGFGSDPPGPTAVTTPAASCPSVNGVATLYMPGRWYTSM